jgi:hypothetical protein
MEKAAPPSECLDYSHQWKFVNTSDERKTEHRLYLTGFI